jgi:hypothetical protein
MMFEDQAEAEQKYQEMAIIYTEIMIAHQLVSASLIGALEGIRASAEAREDGPTDIQKGMMVVLGELIQARAVELTVMVKKGMMKDLPIPAIKYKQLTDALESRVLEGKAMWLKQDQGKAAHDTMKDLMDIIKNNKDKFGLEGE